jgi:predicted transcriptional regulator
MVNLTLNDEFKIKILKQYKKKPIDYTASGLATISNCQYETAKKACEFFYKIGILYKEKKEHGKKDYIYYGLTEIGKILIKSDKI